MEDDRDMQQSDETVEKSKPEQPVSEDSLELSVTDADEATKVEAFFSEGCGCTLGPEGKCCYSVISRELAVISRNNCQEFEEAKLDLVVLSQLQAFHTHPNQPLPSQRQFAAPRRHTNLFFHKLRICLATFLFVYSIGIARFKSLQHHFDTVGIILRVHGNYKCLPSNTSSQEKVDQVLAFIDTTASVHGLPLPGRMPNHRDSDIILLPSDMSKSYIYRKYVESCTQLKNEILSRQRLENLWKELRPFNLDQQTSHRSLFHLPTVH